MATKKPKTTVKAASAKAKSAKPKTAAKTVTKPVSEAPKTNTVVEKQKKVLALQDSSQRNMKVMSLSSPSSKTPSSTVHFLVSSLALPSSLSSYLQYH